MKIPTSHRAARKGSRRYRPWTAAAAAAAVAIAITAAAPTASAATTSAQRVQTTTQVRPATARIGDGDHGYLVFINKSRASLCTAKRIAYENAFLAWLNGGQHGNPPAEPASSQHGVKPVRFTHRAFHNRQTSSIEGPNLPVEVWQEEDNPDGLDCTSTDGPGAKLFARGLMTWTSHSVTTPTATASDTSLHGRVVGVDCRAYNYLIRYLTGQRDGHDPFFKAIIHLIPLR